MFSKNGEFIGIWGIHGKATGNKHDSVCTMSIETDLKYGTLKNLGIPTLLTLGRYADIIR